MADATLTPDEERQLREAFAGDPRGAELKGDFCNCWPAAKRLLEWLVPRVPQKLKDAIALVVRLGDAICEK